MRGGMWEPVGKRVTSSQLQPLSHVSLADQLLATTLTLSLADRVETLHGDQRQPVRDREARRQVVSFDNHLFCDAMSGKLCHLWGSAEVYHAYYQGFQTFLSRPKVAAESILEEEDRV